MGMTVNKDFYVGQRLSYDGCLCTVRFCGPLAETKGVWLGVEWDDVSRGKHNGRHRDRQVFRCLSTSKAPASFVRPTRKSDLGRTVLEAIKFKYSVNENGIAFSDDAVIISGKVAEEIGFQRVARQQARLGELKLAILEDLLVYGLVAPGSSREDVTRAQQQLVSSCPNITELDIGWNPIETWQDIVDICLSLTKLRVLRSNGLRLHSFQRLRTDVRKPFVNVKELYLDECLISLNDAAEMLMDQLEVPALTTLSLSKNELSLTQSIPSPCHTQFSSVRMLLLENNKLNSLENLSGLFTLFPNIVNLSLQGNSISSVGIISKQVQYLGLETLNLSYNSIDSWAFVDSLPLVFPNLSSLRISNNPLYNRSEAEHVSHDKSTERSYYLTLARIPKLASLNYTKIRPRDRMEGELYYLSVAENYFKTKIREQSGSSATTSSIEREKIKSDFPQYERLCLVHERESVIEKYFSETLINEKSLRSTLLEKDAEQNYPKGSLGSRLIDTTFFTRHNTEDVVRVSLPRTVQVNTVKAFLVRHFPKALRPLQFRLVYESQELDPVDPTTESSSHSQAYDKRLTEPFSAREEQWREWGDWDADSMVETVKRAADMSSDSKRDAMINSSETEKWTKAGVMIKQGKKWKRREVEIPSGMRSWGDFIEDGITEAKIRIEAYYEV